MHDFRMPDIGEGLTEAEIVAWHVAVGDRVEIDQIIVEVETAKTVVEIPSVFAGTVISLGASPGDTVEVGDVLFSIGDVEEPGSDRAVDEQDPKIQDPRSKIQASTPAPPSPPHVQPGDRTSVRAMPLVRKLAAERGIDLDSVQGSGPGGSITRADIEAAQPTPTIDGELIPLTPTRRAIAEHMSQSWREIPHVTVQAELRAVSLLTEMKETGNALEACVAKRILPVLHDFPDFNASFTENGVVRKPRHDIGFAVDTEAGLMVVVVRDTDDKSVGELSVEFAELAESAMNRTIPIDKITGQTFTISNIGALGGGHGTPIIPIGTTAILSIGRATEQPIAVDGELAIALVSPIDLSYDHRVIDGGLGQRFLAATVAALEA
jgi:pyruvate/2-oxoglutarate dehydrogenase complex dihydrolipoamide acyltransferase (E2) component